ncbi:thiamine diphosphokinase [Finegoldia magna]|uniref:thiamine diphosphokinase n=1 Tax=Finegoldia magna TaxID=1260 RepID=UPI00290C4C56|nr:thiamine diphosphokinase [Finegoldia magna]MDU5200968.1 thiamine diphosphokinase [Finegoldia magna]MDU5273379.1 thiamine diphosphokinase [Finegoldia magna]MDU6775281.1 thiamine diphosphokinase [Finegoldia magna]
MIGLICCAGELSDKNLFEEYYEKSDFKIAVDGGTKYFTDYHKDFDFAIGDFDSINIEDKTFLEENNKIFEKYNCRKDFTDFEAAINILIEKNCNTIYAFGATGTRLDHTMSNLIYSKRCYEKGIELIFIGNNNIIKFLGESTECVMRYDYISIVVLSNSGMKIKLKGFEYDSEFLDVDFCSTLTISNKIKNKKAYIELIDGYGLLIDSRD